MKPASRTKLRILFLEPVGERGGAEVVLLDILRHLDRSRFEPYVALLSEGPLAEELSGLAQGVHVFRRHRVRQIHRTLLAVFGLVRLSRRLAIDVIHTQGTKTHLYGGLLRRFTNIPELWHIYDPPPAQPEWIDRVVTRLTADAVVFISNGAQASFSRLMDTGKSTIIYPGIDPPLPVTTDDAYRVLERLRIPTSAPLILQISRLQAFKGHETLIRAAARLVDRFPEAHVVMVGGTLFELEPDYPKSLRSLIAELGVSRSVHLSGWLDDRERTALCRHAACLCYAEVASPFSLVILEAMAAGRAVVATRTEASELLVEDRKTGWLVPPKDPVRLAQALGEVLADPLRAEQMGAAGRARQAQHFTAKAMTAAVGRVYEMLSRDV